MPDMSEVNKTVEYLTGEILDHMYNIVDNMKRMEYDWAMVGVDEAQELLGKLSGVIEKVYDKEE